MAKVTRERGDRGALGKTRFGGGRKEAESSLQILNYPGQIVPYFSRFFFLLVILQNTNFL